MKVVYIASPIHDYKDVRIFQKEAISLAENNYQVYLLAQSPQSLFYNGVQIEKAPTYKNRVQRLLNQPVILFKMLKKKVDIYHIHNPDMLIIGFILKLIGKSVIYDTHEDFSKRILMREWIPLFARKKVASIVSGLEKLASNYFDATIVTQPQMIKRFGKKTYLIENAPLLQSEVITKAIEISNNKEKEEGEVRVIYVGGISSTRGLIETIKALHEVNKVFACRMWMIGPCYEKSLIKQLSELPGWEYVDYLGYLTQEEAFAYMIKSDIGMVTILDVGDHSTTSPNKLFEYQRFALPFISSNFPKWVEQVGYTESGMFVNPSNINEIIKGISILGLNPELRKEMGLRGRKFIYNEFNWEMESIKMLEIYKTTIQ